MNLRSCPSRRFCATSIFSLAAVTGLLACGPDFPNCYLSNSIDELTKLPALSFDNELARLIPLRPQVRATATAADAQRQVLLTEQAEVREVLVARGLATQAVEAVLGDYRREKPSTELPLEFHLYARGAVAWHAGRRDEATAAWRGLLALPEEERHYRSVWAAFMLGRALCDRDSGQARQYCRLARDLAAKGFADTQGLADASIGWEARAYLSDRDYVAALRLYTRQFSLGEHSAVSSLQLTLVRVFAGNSGERESGDVENHATQVPRDIAVEEPVLATMASDPQLRRVVTAWFAARGGRSLHWGPGAALHFRRWIRTLPKVNDLPADEADRWCWAAYQNGLWSEARALSLKAPDGAPASEWVRAMLLLRARSVDEAAEHLAKAATGFATDSALAEKSVGSGEEPERYPLQQPLGDSPSAQLGGVRGTLALHREQYAEALRLFLLSHHWSDAAFVAERVLTPDELVKFVSSESLPASGNHDGEWTGELRKLRHLTARRLVREERFDEAQAFFPAELQERYRRYVACVRSGFDQTKPMRRRAESFWSAAQTIREFGMEIQGTELEPDYGIWAGDFQWPDLETERNPPNLRGYWSREAAAEAMAKSSKAPVQPSADELERLQRSRPPGQRFHYRYRATELAWLSAALLPNDDAETALVLNTAGSWLAKRDPVYADLFYKALVVRCPNTDLGRRAAVRRWFVTDSKQQI